MTGFPFIHFPHIYYLQVIQYLVVLYPCIYNVSANVEYYIDHLMSLVRFPFLLGETRDSPWQALLVIVVEIVVSIPFVRLFPYKVPARSRMLERPPQAIYAVLILINIFRLVCAVGVDTGLGL